MMPVYRLPDNLHVQITQNVIEEIERKDSWYKIMTDALLMAYNQGAADMEMGRWPQRKKEQ